MNRDSNITASSSGVVTVFEAQEEALPVAEKAEPARQHTDLLHAAIILAFGAAFRLIYQIGFKPFWCGDSTGYSDIFYRWTIPTFSTSERPPVYSLFLGLVQWLAGDAPIDSGMGTRSQYATVHLQSLLGLVAALLLYFSLRALAVRPKLALAGGLCFSLIGAVCFFELMILSELLSLFFLMLGTLFFLRCIRAVESGTAVTPLALLSGVCFSFAILTRPENLVFFFALIFVLVVLSVRCKYLPEMHMAARPLAKVTLLLLVSSAPLVLCWMTWTLLNIGEFRINTLNGVTRTESTYNMFGLVDEEDRLVGSILSRSYQLKNSDGRIYRHHVWLARPDLQTAYQLGLLPIPSPRPNQPKNPLLLKARSWLAIKLGFREQFMQPVELYDYLGKVSGKLAKKYPFLYLHNVLDNFFRDTFSYNFGPPSPDETDDPRAPEGGSVIRHKALYKVTIWIGRIQAPLLTGSYLVLLAYVLVSPLLLFRPDREHLLRDGAVVALALGAFGTILCSCVYAAFYPQHGVPFTGTLVLCFAYAASNSKRVLSALRPTSDSGLPAGAVTARS